MYDAIVWGSVGAVGIGVAWGVDAWAARTGRSRLLALVGLVPVLVYAAVVLLVSGSIASDVALELLTTEVRRTERTAFRLASACGGMGAAIVLAILARWSWTERRSWDRLDGVGTAIGAGLAVVGVGAGVLTSWRLAPTALPDPLLFVSTGVLLLATVPGVVARGPDAAATWDHRVRTLAFAMLASGLLAVRLAGHLAEVLEWPWWVVARPRLVEVAGAALLEGLVWGALPALVALGSLVPLLPEARPRSALPFAVAALGATVMAGPLVAAFALQATHEPLLDFSSLADGVELPRDDRALGSPRHGCYVRVEPAGTTIVPSQTAVGTACEDLTPSEAEAFVAPASATLADLPGLSPAFYADSVLVLLVRTEREVAYPYRLVPLEHDPDGAPMRGRSLQEVVEACQGEEPRCDLLP